MENEKYIVAIDLGSSDVVAVLGTKDEQGKIVIADLAVVPSKGVVRGEVKNSETAAQSIREALSQIEERQGIEISEVYAGISGSHIKCAKHPYYVYVGNKDGEIMEEDVRKLNESMRNVQAPDGYKLMQIIPQKYIVNDDEEVPDPVGMFGKTLGSTFNLIIGEKIIMSRLEKAFQKINVKQAGVVINALAMAEAVTFPDEKELGVAVVDLGAGITDLCIYQDGIVRYVGVIPLGADAINKDIRSYGIMERYVEELKIKYGCAMSDMVDDEKLVKVPGRTPHDHKEISFRNLATIIEARLMDIIDYVTEEIRSADHEGKLAAGIILTGGCAGMHGIKELFEKKTGLDVRVATPDILVADQSKEYAADPRLSAAIGILAQSFDSGQGMNIRPRRQEPTVTDPEQAIFNPVTRNTVTLNGSSTATPAGKAPLGRTAAVQQPETPAEPLPQENKPPRKGFMQKIRERFEKTFDFDVLDDENEI